jgi:outer membrane protein OmpA-like peptidoglycan-associated protein
MEVGPEGQELLAKLSERLRGGYNRIRVVGTASPGRSETDELLLGFQRARAVQELLVRGKDGVGVRPERIEIATRGTLEPLTLPELIDPERRASRDRVVIILTPEPVEELFEVPVPTAPPAAVDDDEEE